MPGSHMRSRTPARASTTRKTGAGPALREHLVPAVAALRNGIGGAALDLQAVLGVQRLVGNRAMTALLQHPADARTTVQRDDTATTTSAPTTTADDTVAAVKKRIEDVLGGKKPTLKALQKAYLPALYPQRTKIAADSALMGRIKTAIGVPGWMTVMADLEAQAQGGTVAHATAKATDATVRKELKDYVGKAVKSGRTARGKVMILEGQDWLDAYYHEFPDELPRGGPTDEEPLTNAFTTTSPPKNLIVLNKDKGNPGTSVHEGVHLYQNNAMLNRYGNEVNEAITEYFTRKVTGPMGIVRANYEDNLVAGQALVDAVGEQVVANAFFDGKTGALEKALVQFQKAKGEADAKKAWTNFVGWCRAKEFDKAAAWCE
ncbi:MAG: hypothetical protein KY469_09955 [Actinobacteria bacterium]|nr:hypothetical protein [Actinomycetota bacterium]